MDLGEAQVQFLTELEENGTAMCPCCERKARAADSKSLNKWMAAGLEVIADYFAQNPASPGVHIGTLLEKTPGSKGHDVSLTRHWGLLVEVPRPEEAPRRMKGSRGLSGWYKMTELGVRFVRGEVSIPREIYKPFGCKSYIVQGKLISIHEAKRVILAVNDQNMIVDGTAAA